jgi:hypothetical protein
MQQDIKIEVVNTEVEESPPTGLRALVLARPSREDVEAYLRMLDFQERRPDLRGLLVRNHWVASLVNRDLVIPLPDSEKWTEPPTPTLPDAGGADVDLLFHRCMARAYLPIDGRRLQKICADAKERGILVHDKWLSGYRATDQLRVECALTYFVPDAAWGARGCVNSPIDGAPYGTHHKRMRDCDWGSNPVNLLIPLDDLIRLEPCGGDDLEITVMRYGLPEDLRKFVSSLPLAWGYAGTCAIDGRGYKNGVDEDGYSMDAKLLRAHSVWDGEGNSDHPSDLHYFYESSALTCIQRIFTVQEACVTNARIIRERCEEWAPPKIVKRQRRRGPRGGASPGGSQHSKSPRGRGGRPRFIGPKEGKWDNFKGA